MAKKSTGSDFVLGAMIGGLVGAATALFLAPKAGKEFRDNLSEQAQAIRGKTSQYRTIAIEKGTEFAEIAKEKTISLTQAVTEQSSHLVDAVKNATNQDANESKVASEDAAEALLEEVEGSEAKTEDGFIPLKTSEEDKINF
jgi:gas vesicle protein